MTETIEDSWKNALATEFAKPYFMELTSAVRTAYNKETVYPPQDTIFKAFSHCPLPAVRVVILGQDPYHGPGQAHGLAFSVPNGVRIPPSLHNIYKEIASDLNILPPSSGNLERWADQGVLLLNTTLTVQAHQAGSHHKLGWEIFTDTVIETVSKENENVVFLLWGNYACGKKPLINKKKHYVLEAPHPSPLSAHRGFFGCRHFSQTNDYLVRHGQVPIRW